MKNFISKILVVLLVVMSLCGCTPKDNTPEGEKPLKFGVILVGDENEGYTYAHIDGIKQAAAANNVADDQIIWKYSVGESQDCYDAAIDLVEQGCNVVFSNSYGHQSYMQKAAEENPSVQ